jgi:hypothetical protein
MNTAAPTIHTQGAVYQSCAVVVDVEVEDLLTVTDPPSADPPPEPPPSCAKAIVAFISTKNKNTSLDISVEIDPFIVQIL